MTKRKQFIRMFLCVISILFVGLIMTGCTSDDLGLGLGGKSAYQIAVENGFTGTEQEWLASLKGESGEYAGKGASAYEIAVRNGFTGSEQEWLASLNTSDDKYAYNLNRCLSSVVSISATFTSSASASQGSGVIMSYDKSLGYAYVLTNYHVICSSYENGGSVSNSISTYLYGRKYNDLKLTTTYIGGSPENDLAVLKVYISSDVANNTVITPATLGNSSEVAVGEKIGAIGNARGNGVTLTSGVVSVESEFSSIERNDNGRPATIRVMRFDAYITNGNSGGGLFNIDGKLVGIVNAKSKTDEFYFAIPSNLAYSVYQNILQTCGSTSKTTISRLMLGVSFSVVDSNLIEDSTTGMLFIKEKVRVSDVISSTARANFISGDVFVSVKINSGKEIKIRRFFDLTDAMWGVKSGDTLQFKVIRNSEIKTIQLTASNAYVSTLVDASYVI